MIEIRGTTTLVGLLGWPTSHSLSPPMQNAGFSALGLDWAYVPLPTPPERLARGGAGPRGDGLRRRQRDDPPQAGGHRAVRHARRRRAPCRVGEHARLRRRQGPRLVDRRRSGHRPDRGRRSPRARPRRWRCGQGCRRGASPGRRRRDGAHAPRGTAGHPRGRGSRSWSTARRSRTSSSSRRRPGCRWSTWPTTPTARRLRSSRLPAQPGATSSSTASTCCCSRAWARSSAGRAYRPRSWRCAKHFAAASRDDGSR